MVVDASLYRRYTFWIVAQIWIGLATVWFAAVPCLSQEKLRTPNVGSLNLEELLTPKTSGVWEQVCSTPAGYVPQGVALRCGRLYLSAHKGSRQSAFFELAADESRFDKVFDLPEDATHTSGIDFHPENQDLLFAVDYDSDQIYVIDFVKSKKEKAAVVLTKIESRLKGTSACCFVQVPRIGLRLLVTDFSAPAVNVFFAYDADRNKLEKEEGLSYRNQGFSQGVTFHDGFVYETGNRLLSSYVVKHNLKESLQHDRI